MNSVFIEDKDGQITRMFKDKGWAIVDNPEAADLLCFGGGSDVSPMLYEQAALPTTRNDPKRDSYNADLFYTYYGKKPMVGICRGGQFLNVMCGGELYQHIHGHLMDHEAYDPATGEITDVTSSHHQMMIPHKDGEILLVADECLDSPEPLFANYVNEEPDKDVEAVLYEEDKVLCFQPHPEWVDEKHPCAVLFFNYLNDLMKKD